MSMLIKFSLDWKSQISLARQHFEQHKKDVYIVAIDAEVLTSKIINLSSDDVRRHLLSGSHQAIKFAKAWSEVLVVWEVPSEAIVESVRYYIDSEDGEDVYEMLKNPNYNPSNPRAPRHEGANFPESIDFSTYPF